MSMQTDVKALELTATGEVVGRPARVKAITVSYESDATVELTDGGAAGVLRWSFTAPADTGVAHVLLPEQGIRFYEDIYATIADCTITVVYG